MTCPICLEEVSRTRDPYQCPRCNVEICYTCWERDMTMRPGATCPTCRYGAPMEDLQLEARKHYSFGVFTGIMNAFCLPYIGTLIFFEIFIACLTGWGGYRALRSYIEHPRLAIDTMGKLKMASVMGSVFSLLAMGITLQNIEKPTLAFCWIFSTIFGIVWGIWYMHLRSAKRWIELFRNTEETISIV